MVLKVLYFRSREGLKLVTESAGSGASHLQGATETQEETDVEDSQQNCTLIDFCPRLDVDQGLRRLRLRGKKQLLFFNEAISQGQIQGGTFSIGVRSEGRCCWSRPRSFSPALQKKN